MSSTKRTHRTASGGLGGNARGGSGRMLGVWAVLVCAGAALGEMGGPGGADDAAKVGVPAAISIRVDPLRPMRAVPVQVREPSDQVRVLDVSSDAPEVVGVEPVAVVLPGQTIAWAWLRPAGPGAARVRVGDETIVIDVRGAAKLDDQPDTGLTLRPRVDSPTAGAGVTGVTHVGVSAMRSPWNIGSEGAVGLSLRVVPVGDGVGGGGGESAILEPTWTLAPGDGTRVLAGFAVDTATLAPGAYDLVAQRVGEDLGEPGAVLSSGPVRVVVPAGRGSDGLRGECETDYGILLDKQMGPPKPVASVRDPGASGGRFFAQSGGGEPRFRFPVSVPQERGAGYYQVILTAGGDAASGVLPAVGITIDEAQRPSTTGQIAMGPWHRVSIGVPVLLGPGDHIVRCDFLNDFAARGLDRNLRLDAIELVRVGDAGGQGARAAGEAGMMAMQAMAPAPMMATPSPMVGEDQAAKTPMAMSDAAEMTGAGGAGPATGGWPATASAAFRPPVRLAVASPAGYNRTGPLRAAVTFEGSQGRTPIAPPRTELMIDGEIVWSQRSVSPRFAFATIRDGIGRLCPVHSVELRSTTDSGFVVSGPGMGASAAEAALARLSRRATVFDAGWDGLPEKGWRDNLGGAERWSAPVPVGGEVTWSLPGELAGEYELLIEGRSVAAGARAVEVQVEGASEKPLKATLPTYTDEHRVTVAGGAALVLPAGGNRRLVIRDVGQGGRRETAPAVFVQAVQLVPRAGSHAALAQFAGSGATLEHPRSGEALFDVDVAVVRPDLAAGDRARTFRVLIDGKPAGPVFDARRVMARGDAAAVVPVLLRGVAAGERRLGVRIETFAGRVVDAERVVRVLDREPEGGTRFARGAALLNRIALGPDPRELARVLSLGEEAYIAMALAEPRDDQAAAQGWQRLPAWRSTYDVPRRALHEAVVTGTPVQARFALWAQNHFSTWVRKVEAQRKSDEHDRFAALGVSDFHTLLITSAAGPSMLRYLDQERSYAGRINENYAREIMELHCLGVEGGYTQQDVTNLSHVLAGWTTMRLAPATRATASPDEDGVGEAFAFEPRLASTLDEPRTVLGAEFGPVEPAARLSRALLATELLVAHPATARFVCTKLIEHYVGVPASENLVADLASVFTRSDGDFKAVLLELTRRPEFWEAALERSRVAQPTDFALRLARTTAWDGARQVGDFLGASGHGMFERATPDGYPEADAEAMDSNAMLQRWKLASQAEGAIADAVPGSMRYGERPIDAAEAQVIVDLIALRLVGRLLGEASNSAALEVLNSTEPQRPERPADWNRDPRVRTVAGFVAQLPEASLK